MGGGGYPEGIESKLLCFRPDGPPELCRGGESNQYSDRVRSSISLEAQYSVSIELQAKYLKLLFLLLKDSKHDT